MIRTPIARTYAAERLAARRDQPETGHRSCQCLGQGGRLADHSPFTSQHLSTLLCSENKADLIVLTEMIESGQVTPVIGKVYPLSETIAANRYMRDGHPRGKVVIDISDESHR